MYIFNISKYFIRKSISKTQKIIEEKTDGSLVFSVEITSIMEIKNIILNYLPNLKIISPKELDTQIKEEFIKPYMND